MEWTLCLIQDETYQTPFFVQPGAIYSVGAIGLDVCTMATLVVLHNYRWSLTVQLMMEGGQGERVSFYYIPPGEELCGLRVKLSSGAVSLSEPRLTKEVTFFIHRLCPLSD
jgi:hypothetical protein